MRARAPRGSWYTERGRLTIAFPLLLRELEEVTPGFPGEWRDVTSVYGYAGPLASPPPLPEETRARWISFVDAFFRDQHVVSAFSRLHPLLEQTSLLQGFGEVVPVGWTLSLDLRQSEEEQWNGFRRNHRQDIKRLIALGVTCEQAGVEQLDEFIEMYYDTMDRVGASPLYYFSKHYFTRLLEDLPGWPTSSCVATAGGPWPEGSSPSVRGSCNGTFPAVPTSRKVPRLQSSCSNVAASVGPGPRARTRFTWAEAWEAHATRSITSRTASPAASTTT